MAIVRKETAYSLFGFCWLLAAGAGFVVVVSGNAEPDVSPDLVPEPRVAYGGGVAAAVAIPGFVTGRLLKRRAWAGMGRRVGLSGGGGLFAYPDMTGTHRGGPSASGPTRVGRAPAAGRSRRRSP